MEIVRNKNVKAPGVDKNVGIDRTKFLNKASWIKHHLTTHDGSVITIADAFKQSFAYDVDVMEEKIEQARAENEKLGPDPCHLAPASIVTEQMNLGS